MNNLLKMTQGVEWVTIKEVAQVGTGSGNRQDASENGAYPFYVRSKEIFRNDSYEFNEEAIIIPGEGGIGEIFHYVNGKYALHQRAYRIHFFDDRITTKFAYYYFRNSFKDFIMQKAVNATVTSIRKPMIEDFPIPLPPLPVQEEIVRMLDAMSELQENLEKELEERRKQFAYYRDKLMTFNDLTTPPSQRIEWKQLGDICKIIAPPAKLQTSEYLREGTYPVIDQGKHLIVGYTNNECNTLPIGEYLLYGDHTCSVKYFNGQFAQGADGLKILQPIAGLCKYLFYAVCTFNIKSSEYKRHWSEVKKISIPLPPLSIQQEIVEKLDKMEELINNIESELVERKRQYEHYREQLLSSL